MSEWRYWNHAMLPTCQPHEAVNEAAIRDKSIWKLEGGKALLARWTTNYDCGYETDWWYTIKDTPLDIAALSSKRRRWLIRVRENFEVRPISPKDHAQELYEVQVAACSAYPKKYRPHIDHDAFVAEICAFDGTMLGAFVRNRETDTADTLCGYCYITVNGKCIDYNVHKSVPQYEKIGVNYALVDGALRHFDSALRNGYYFCNGQRNTNHETAFNDFLERNFGWRKAYCTLHIAYRPAVRPLIKVLYPFRKLLKLLNGIGLVHKLNAILTMEQIARKPAAHP